MLLHYAEFYVLMLLTHHTRPSLIPHERGTLYFRFPRELPRFLSSPLSLFQKQEKPRPQRQPQRPSTTKPLILPLQKPFIQPTQKEKKPTTRSASP